MPIYPVPALPADWPVGGRAAVREYLQDLHDRLASLEALAASLNTRTGAIETQLPPNVEWGIIIQYLLEVAEIERKLAKNDNAGIPILTVTPRGLVPPKATDLSEP